MFETFDYNLSDHHTTMNPVASRWSSVFNSSVMGAHHGLSPWFFIGHISTMHAHTYCSCTVHKLQVLSITRPSRDQHQKPVSYLKDYSLCENGSLHTPACLSASACFLSWMPHWPSNCPYGWRNVLLRQGISETKGSR